MGLKGFDETGATDGQPRRRWHREVREFEVYLRLERKMSEHSVEAYLHDVDLLRDFALSMPSPKGPEAIEKGDVEVLLRALGEDDVLGPRSQARLLSGVRQFYRYLQVSNAIEADPTSLIDPPKLGQHLPEVLTVDEVNAMEAAIDLSDPLGHRNMAIVETLFSCGLRVSELCAMQISRIYGRDGFVRVLGKGNKERLVPIGDKALGDIENYVAQRRAWTIAEAYADVLFLNRRRKPITRVMVFYIIKDLASKAGIRKNVSPHTLRHSFATELVRGGADLRVVQAMLGHESIVTTEIYTHLSKEHLRETLLRYHPRGDR